MVYHPDDTTKSPEEDTEYADIYIPVPYDPEIPGVRGLDVEEGEYLLGRNSLIEEE